MLLAPSHLALHATCCVTHVLPHHSHQLPWFPLEAVVRQLRSLPLGLLQQPHAAHVCVSPCIIVQRSTCFVSAQCMPGPSCAALLTAQWRPRGVYVPGGAGVRPRRCMPAVCWRGLSWVAIAMCFRLLVRWRCTDSVQWCGFLLV